MDPSPGRNREPCSLVLLLVLIGLLATGPNVAQAREFDPQAAWPLCGRISENPPHNWREEDGCPPDRFGKPGYSDAPLSSTFGPRPLYSENYRYDFHRGLDIAAPIGTPFFAISDGRVEIAGEHPSYSDPLVKLRHYRPGNERCLPDGCYYSLYLHVHDWLVSDGQTVSKGQLLGHTGASSSGFEHLHFEIRNAPGYDPYSAWSRDAIQPLRLLPYQAAFDTTSE